MAEAGTLKFVYTAGALTRTDFVRNLRAACWRLDLNLELQEERGWLDSVYLIKATGPDEKLQHLRTWLWQLSNVD